MSQLPQLKANAALVIEKFGKHSGLVPFAYTRESVDYLDGFLDRQAAVVNESEASRDLYVSLLGAYLGECIIARHGGEWVESPQGLALRVRAGQQVHLLQPFHKVYRRITEGHGDLLGPYFTDFVPRVLGLQEGAHA